jgi:3-phosphoglycerate kinase
MNLPKPESLNVAGKRVLLRLDLDTKPDENDLRINAAKETLDYLYSQKAKIIIIGHKGRPNGKADESLSLKQFEPIFSYYNAEVKENLRFNPGEEANSEEFAKEIASWGDVYINEAFASSHREHASIVGVPKYLPHAAGYHFMAEVENLSKVFEPIRPLVFVISGVKEDKLPYVKEFEKFADKVLVGGRLPDYMGDEKLVSVRSRGEGEKVIVGNLIMDKEDITIHTIERFEKEIENAGTVVVSGPLGKYEDEGHRQGTERVFKAVAQSGAFKIAGGGDTEAALGLFGLDEEFDWVSVGGGAMLEFLAKKTLPGIKALEP